MHTLLATPRYPWLHGFPWLLRNLTCYFPGPGAGLVATHNVGCSSFLFPLWFFVLSLLLPPLLALVVSVQCVPGRCCLHLHLSFYFCPCERVWSFFTIATHLFKIFLAIFRANAPRSTVKTLFPLLSWLVFALINFKCSRPSAFDGKFSSK